MSFRQHATRHEAQRHGKTGRKSMVDARTGSTEKAKRPASSRPQPPVRTQQRHGRSITAASGSKSGVWEGRASCVHAKLPKLLQQAGKGGRLVADESSDQGRTKAAARVNLKNSNWTHDISSRDSVRAAAALLPGRHGRRHAIPAASPAATRSAVGRSGRASIRP